MTNYRHACAEHGRAMSLGGLPPAHSLSTCELDFGADGGGAALEDSLAQIVSVAMGRIGGQLAPWLDESLLMGQGLATLLELSDVRAGAQRSIDGDLSGEIALRHVVSGMRNWARASSWFMRAWPCRIAPLCAALVIGGDDRDELLAGDLGLDSAELAERYTEAGLLFGVSPELMLPGLNADHHKLAEAINARAVNQRRVLTLYFQEALSFPEIAELLDLPRSRVQELYGRAAVGIRASMLIGSSGLFGAGG